MLARKSRAPVFSGNRRMSWEKWNDSKQRILKKLNSEQQIAMETNEKSLVKTSVPESPEEQISILLNSADDGAKMIVF